MKKHMKNLPFIFCFLGITTVFQSCMIYKTSTVDKAAEYAYTKIEIEMNNGDIYKLKWIEQRGDTIYSKTNIRRAFVNKDKIDRIWTVRFDGINYSFDSTNNSLELILVRTLEYQDRDSLEVTSYNYQFTNIVDAGDYIIGYEKPTKDPTDIAIPISGIRDISTVNKTASTINSTLIGAAIIIPVIWLIIEIANYESPCWWSC